jgi:hypothetical protein
MKKSGLLKVLCVLVTSVVLICMPESSFAAGGHGGGGGGHGGGFGGGFHGGGGGFHGGGFGGYHGAFGGGGWRGGWGGYGWRGGWGYPGWGRGWGWGYPGWGWGVGIGFGWGWGSYWPSYPYAYGYPYYYPYSPNYPYYGPDAYAPADPDRYNGGGRDPRDNSQQQNSEYPDSEYPHSEYPGPERSTGVNDAIPARTFASHRTAGDSGSAKYWLANYQQHMVPRQAVRNVIQALLAMPPEARRRQIESGRYRDFSPEEQEFLNQVAQGVGRVGESPKKADEMKPEGLRLASQ